MLTKLEVLPHCGNKIVRFLRFDGKRSRMETLRIIEITRSQIENTTALLLSLDCQKCQYNLFWSTQVKIEGWKPRGLCRALIHTDKICGQGVFVATYLSPPTDEYFSYSSSFLLLREQCVSEGLSYFCNRWIIVLVEIMSVLKCNLGLENWRVSLSVVDEKKCAHTSQKYDAQM